MGQRHSTIALRPKLSFIWVLRCEQCAKRGRRQRVFAENAGMNCNGANCERRNSKKEGQTPAAAAAAVDKEDGDTKKRSEDNIRIYAGQMDCQDKRIVHEFRSHPASRKNYSGNSLEIPTQLVHCCESAARGALEALEKTRAERAERANRGKRALSEPTRLARRGSASSSIADGTDNRRDDCPRREKRLAGPSKCRGSSSSSSSSKSSSYESGGGGGANTFGYAIADLDALLTQASIERPANVPVVLSFPSVLYQTRGGIQVEMSLPLGTVANAIFKNQAWLYVQTPHGHEGYVGSSSCLPLGVASPQPEKRAPCWEDPTDIFPRPLGNTGDASAAEYSCHRRSECVRSSVRVSRVSRVRHIARVDARDPESTATLSGERGTGERNVDRLYLEALAVEHSPRMAPNPKKDFVCATRDGEHAVNSFQ